MSATVSEQPPAAAEAAKKPSSRRRKKKRMLIIVNPYATTVSDRLKNLVVYALQARYDVEAVDTEARTTRSRSAARPPTAATTSSSPSAATGPSTRSPTGSPEPTSPSRCCPAAPPTSSAARSASPTTSSTPPSTCSAWPTTSSPARIDLGTATAAASSSPAAPDSTRPPPGASTPTRSSRRAAGRWYYTWAAVSGFYRSYLRNPVTMRVDDRRGEADRGVTAIAQNSDPFTYFGNQPAPHLRGRRLANGTLSVAMLRRAAQRDVPTIASRVAERPPADLRPPPDRPLRGDHRGAHRSVSERRGRRDPRRFPVQVDGDYIGESTEVDIGIEPGALTVVA